MYIYIEVKEEIIAFLSSCVLVKQQVFLPGLFPLPLFSTIPSRGSSCSFWGWSVRGGTPACRATHIELPFLSQDEKNQVLTTYIWYRQVSRPACALLFPGPGPGLYPPRKDFSTPEGQASC